MSLEGIDFFENQYYAHIRRLLSTVDLWPYHKSSKGLGYGSFIIIMLIIANIFQVVLLLTSELDMETITDLLYVFLPSLCFSSAYFNLLFNSVAIKKTLERFRSDWYKLTSKQELIIMQTYANESKLYSQAIAYVMVVNVICKIFPSLIYFVKYACGMMDYHKIKLPVHNDAFMMNKTYCFLTLGAELMIIILSSMIAITHYSVFVSFMQHACALFTIVTDRIDEPFKKNKYKFNCVSSSSKCEEELEWIVTVIKYYNHAIDFVELIKLLYGRLYIIELSTSLFVVIIDFLYFFDSLKLMFTMTETIRNFIYIAGNILVIFSYVYIGQKLIDRTSYVHTKCCLIPFYSLSVKTNKLLLLVLTRSIKSSNISAGGIFVASNELFTKITNTSFSFAMVCLKMREGTTVC